MPRFVQYAAMHKSGAAIAELPQTDLAILCEGIVLRSCVDAVYNRQTMRFAPHIVYTKHGDLFVDAVVIDRDGKKPREIKIGSFKLAGLSGVGRTNRGFDPEPSFDRSSAKYAEATICVVEPGPLSTAGRF